MSIEPNAWIVEQPGEPAQQKPQRGCRRSHTKSRLGCQTCKQGRIKCDELRPKCSQCEHRQRECIYNTAEKTDSFEGRAPVPLPNSLSILSSRLDVVEYDYERELLAHFVQHKGCWLGTAQVQRLMQDDAVRLASTAPYLKHAILAFAAAHLSHLHPDRPTYELIFTTEYDKALQQFSCQLRHPLTVEKADALFACSFLHSMIAFWRRALDACDENADWIRSSRVVPLLRDMDAIRDGLSSSLWYDVLLTSCGMKPLPSPEVDRKTEQWVQDLMHKFKELCYKEPALVVPVDCLGKLLRSQDEPRRVKALMILTGTLPEDFSLLVGQAEPRSLLICSYWFAVLCDINQWWVKKSAIMECRRICQRLAYHPQSLIQDLLQFPKEQSNLPLPD